jgi:hypothetical protein
MCLPFRLLSHPPLSSFHILAHWNINEPPPALSRLQQRPSWPQSTRSGTRAARSSEEESGGEDGAFALGIREENECVVFGCGVKEEGEGEGEGMGGVGVEEEERASGASLPVQAAEVEVGEGAVESRLSPRQMRPSAGFAATTACAGGHSAGRGMQRVVSAGTAARAVVSVESAGSLERGRCGSWCAACTQLITKERKRGRTNSGHAVTTSAGASSSARGAG